MKIDFSECPVPILQNEWEFGMLLDIFKNLNPRGILEIGSFFGGTLWYWIKNSYYPRTIVSIDLPITKADARYDKMCESRAKWGKWVGKEMEFAYISGDSRNEQVISKVQKIFSGDKKVDWLFIDGGHDYDTVNADYVNYAPLVRKDGLVIFHDILHETGVRAYWNKVKNGKSTIEINKEFGLGIICYDEKCCLEDGNKPKYI